jgi:hypothetical protein
MCLWRRTLWIVETTTIAAHRFNISPAEGESRLSTAIGSYSSCQCFLDSVSAANSVQHNVGFIHAMIIPVRCFSCGKVRLSTVL